MALLQSAGVKAVRKQVDEIDPWRRKRKENKKKKKKKEEKL